MRDKGQFTTFRTHDVGEPGGIQRVAGKRRSGSWDDHKWLIGKEQAHIEKGELIPDTEDARAVLEALGSEPVNVGDDRFKAKPRVNVPEKDKPTPAQRKARQENIRKAQAARQKIRAFLQNEVLTFIEEEYMTDLTYSTITCQDLEWRFNGSKPASIKSRLVLLHDHVECRSSRAALPAGAIEVGTSGWDPLHGHGIINAAASYMRLRSNEV